MRLFLDLTFAFADEEAEHWWRTPTLLEKVVSAIEETGLRFGFDRIKSAAGKPIAKLAGPGALPELARAWKEGLYVASAAAGGEEATNLAFGLRHDRFILQVDVASRDLARPRLIESLIALTVATRLALDGEAFLELTSCIRTLRFQWTRPRPPRRHPAFSSLALVDFLDERTLQLRARNSPEADLPGALARARSAPLPKGVGRSTHGPLLVLRWIGDTLAEKAVADACYTHERWLGEALGAVPAPGWNEAGDQAVAAGPMGPHAPLTFYDAGARHGYKTAIVTEDGQIDDEEAWQEIAGWAHRGALPDGTPLDEMRVILSSREAVLAVAARARRDGIAKVLYIAAGGTLWDPFPAGGGGP
jgi:hypothetical protein